MNEIENNLQWGKVFWITGLAGAGKTTFGKLLLERIKQEKEKVIFLDGDDLRNSICDDLGYSAMERKKCGFRYSKLCGLLAGQGFDVVCCTISMFEEIRMRNRTSFPKYCEIYMKTDLEILYTRNQKELYKSESRTIDNVVGIDVKYEEPECPDYTILTCMRQDLKDYVEKIMREVYI